jgi:hypothetical protein
VAMQTYHFDRGVVAELALLRRLGNGELQKTQARGQGDRYDLYRL